MCGRVNPEDAQACLYCEARLKPAWDENSQEIPTESSPQPGSDAEDFSSWLASVSKLESPKNADSQGDEPVPDWLRGLRDDAGIENFLGEQSSDLDAFVGGQSGDRELPEWLRDIVPSSDSSAEFPKNRTDFEQFQDEDPDWMRRISNEASFDPLAGETELPEQTRSADQEVFPSEPESIQFQDEEDVGQEQIAEPDLLAWLSPHKEEEDVLDWLSKPEQFQEEPLSEELEEEHEFSAWLDSSIGEAASEDEPSAEEEPKIEWSQLEQSLAASVSDEESPSEAALEEVEESEALPAEFLPEWLSAPERERDTEPEVLAVEPVQEQEKELPGEPGSMFGLDAPQSEELTDSAETIFAEESQPAFNLEGWQLDEVQDQEESGEVELFDNDLSWLEKVETKHPGDPYEDVLSSQEETQEPEELEIQPAEQYPGWLSEIVKPEMEDQSPAFTSEISQEAISTADLPSWLKAMRPMETLDLDGKLDQEDQEQPEKAGPLAGLVGALPAEPDIIQSARLPAYTLQPRISEIHQSHASMLAELIEQEGVARPTPQAPIVKSQSLQRIAIGIILFVVILFSLVTNAQTFVPTTLDSQVFVANQLITSLSSNAPVLVAVDFTPGFSGELAVNLEPVLASVRSQGGHLVMISTIPTGALQADLLIASLEFESGGSNAGAYTNLGYLPGGSTGIAAFAQAPKETMPFDTSSENAWDDPALQSINSIGDFSLFVVASENPDTVRMWIEQTKTAIAGKPIITVASAQNEPAVRPYYDAYPRQVQGLLGGLSSAAQYETLVGVTGAATSYWPTFMIALTAAVLIILIGSVFNAALRYLNRSTSTKGFDGKG